MNNISNLKQMTYSPDLKSSDTNKAFEYFEKVQEYNLYVVCHSHIMQHIIKKMYNVDNVEKKEENKENRKKTFGFFGGKPNQGAMGRAGVTYGNNQSQYEFIKCTKENKNKMNIITTFKDFFKNIKDENMWDFKINYNNKNITFVRHAFSVANIYNERAKKHMVSFATKNKIDQVREKDAKLSLFGILSALKMSEKKKYNLESNQNVYVSCLIRTWMTAICLFLPKMDDNGKLTLIVAPGIREEKETNDNLPDPIHVQIKNIRYFYNEFFNQ